MWEGGNVWAEGRNNAQLASFQAMVHGFHVLLVDHDREALVNTAKQLETCRYKVTFVELASAAISMLLSGKGKFDVVMANINSPDLHGLKLLQHSVNLCIPVVLMSEDDNVFIAMRALEDGAFLYIKKPLPTDFLKCLWQHIVREKARMVREREMYVPPNNLEPAQGVEFREAVHHRVENPNSYSNPNPNPNMVVKNKGKYKNKSRDRHEDYNEEYDSEMRQKGNLRKKMCTEWTQELHAKFMNAIEQLGEGRCFPKEILEMMNEPGLTRMQVASHLQKCRNDNWRSPDERKLSNQTSSQAASSVDGPQPKPRRFGSKPLVNKPHPGQVQMKAEEAGQGFQTPNNSVKMGNGSIMTNDAPRHNQNPKHGADEFFNFMDMDSLTRNFSGGRQGPGINNQLDRVQERYGADPGYNDGQNTGEASSQTKSPWSSDASNLDSDHSETKAVADH